MEKEIVQATAAHIEQLVTLRLDFYEDIGHDLRADGDMADALRAYYKAALADGSFAAWFIMKDGRPVSTVFLVLQNTLPGRRMRSGRMATVLNVFTYPEYRGRGYAKALVRHLQQYARERDVELLDLWATSMGEPVYRTLGFAEAMAEDLYMAMDPRAVEDSHAKA